MIMTDIECKEYKKALTQTLAIEQAIRDLLKGEYILDVCKKYNLNRRTFENYLKSDILLYSYNRKPYPTDKEQLKQLTVYDIDLPCIYFAEKHIVTVEDILNMSFEVFNQFEVDTKKKLVTKIHSLDLKMNDDIEKENRWYDPEYAEVQKNLHLYELSFLDDEAKKLLTTEDIQLSIRTYNILKRAGVTTVEDILNADIKGLLVLRHIGKRSLKEIISTIHKLGLSFPSGNGEYTEY